MAEPSPERPVYAKVSEEEPGDPGNATGMFMVTVDEGWRKSILCEGMYEWAADWLIGQIQGKPFAPARVAAAAQQREG